MKSKVQIILAALIVLVALIASGTAYAKSRKPVLVVICPVQTTVIDYVINPDKVTLTAYDKCVILKGNRAAKGGAVVVPPGDPPNDPPTTPPTDPPTNPPPTDPPGDHKPPACTKSNGKAPIKNPHCNGSK